MENMEVPDIMVSDFIEENVVPCVDLDERVIDSGWLSELAYIMGEDEDIMESMVYDMWYSIVD